MEAPGAAAPSRRKVLVVTTWFPSEDRPTEAPFNLQHAKAVAEFADVRVVHIRLGSVKPAVDETEHGLRVRRLSLSPRHPLAALRSLAALRRALREADVVHTMAFSSIAMVILAAPLGRVPWVHTEHWNGVMEPGAVSRGWQRMSWLRGILSAPDALTAVTRSLGDVLERFGAARAAVVPCVVENPNPVVPAPTGSSLELVSIGGLVERKRPILAVQTVATLLERGVPAMLTWVGEGVLRKDVVAEAARLGVADRVRLVGSVEPQAVFGFLSPACLYFGPTERENFFTAAAEALSAGRPVVVAPVGGFTEYLTVDNSVLVDDQTAEGFADGIQKAAERFAGVDPASIADPIRAQFGARAVSDRFAEVYARELASRGARPYLLRVAGPCFAAAFERGGART